MRSDLPGYLADSEADGVCVINWYHKQFKMAAKERYFTCSDDYLYYHSYMSDYFLGTYGGGGFSFSIHLFPLRHPQAFPLHRDPETHLQLEEQR